MEECAVKRTGDHNLRSGGELPKTARITGRFQTLSVLCVYEDPLFLDRICRNLEEGGDVFVEISVSVEDALHLMVYVHFDVVVTGFLDWNGEPNGFLRAVREKRNEIPFIYFTGEGNTTVFTDAQQYGNVRDLTWKDGAVPVPFGRLLRCIHAVTHKPDAGP